MPLINITIETLIHQIATRQISSLQFTTDFIKEYATTNHPFAYLDLIDELLAQPLTKYFVSSALEHTIVPTFTNQFADTEPERCINLFLTSHPIDPNDQETNLIKISNFLTSNEKFTSFIPRYFEVLNIETQSIMFKLLFQSSVKKYNASMLHLLKKINPMEYETLLNNFSGVEQAKIEQMANIEDDRSRAKFTELMSQFTNGYGKIRYDGALLTCAQIRQRKIKNHADYVFDATVLKGENSAQEFKDYLLALKNLKQPLQRVFIIYDVHWYAGVVKIDETGNAQIFLIDSLGKDSKYFPDDLIKAFAEVFLDDPNSKIYFSYEKRQHALLGCSVYSIDDAVHLFTVEKYLDEIYKATGLFGYLAAHVDQVQLNTELDEINIVSAKLPLSFLRSKQSISLLEELFPSRAQSGDDLNAPINKDKESVLQSSQVDFVEGINRSIEVKLQNMADNNANYLLENINNLDEIFREMEKASLSGFISSLNQSTISPSYQQ